MRDRATVFFMQQFIFYYNDISCSNPYQDSHEYLLGLILNQESAFGLLGTTVAAAGFAALSNAGNVSVWRVEAFRLYDSAIRQLNSRFKTESQGCLMRRLEQ